jgi:regulatory protein
VALDLTRSQPEPSSSEEGSGAVALSPGERLVDPALRLQHALDVAYRYLGRRDRTVREVRQHLENKRVEPATIDEAVADLLEAGYLDDARYAVRFAEDRRTLDSWGAERIERKLQTVGVAAEHIQAALAQQDATDERGAALAALQRRYAEPLASPRERERALGFLVRKGYSMDVAYDAIRDHGRDPE